MTSDHTLKRLSMLASGAMSVCVSFLREDGTLLSVGSKCVHGLIELYTRVIGTTTTYQVFSETAQTICSLHASFSWLLIITSDGFSRTRCAYESKHEDFPTTGQFSQRRDPCSIDLESSSSTELSAIVLVSFTSTRARVVSTIALEVAHQPSLGTKYHYAAGTTTETSTQLWR